jgi:Fur family ferric uptake transcriptional regulator
MKKTRQRSCVLFVLEQAESPLSALDIFRGMEKEDAGVSLSTVYRILELFVREQVALRSGALENGTALFELNRHRHRHYAVCMGCHRIVEMENCPLESFAPQLSDSGFRVLEHRVELFGYCRDCDKKQ